MVKKLLACFVFLLVMVSSACAEVELEHYSFATLKDGKADYSDARFEFSIFGVNDTGLTLTEENKNLTGSMTIDGGSYSFWNGTEIQKVSGTQQTFKLAVPTWQKIGEEAEFDLFTYTGGDLRLGIEADNGLNGVNVRWNFPNMPSLNGTFTIPHYLTTQEQMNKHVVYFEFIRSGENVTGINWRVVKASDTSTPVTLDYSANFLRLKIWNFDEESICNLKPSFHIEPGQTPEGVLMFDDPIKESDIWRVATKFYTYDEEVGKCYYWYYCKPTQSELHLFTHHNSDASLVNGKSDYSDAKFSDISLYVVNEEIFVCEAKHLTGEGRVTIPVGGYTLKNGDTGETLNTVANGTNMTFKLQNDIEADIGGTYVEYKPADDSGRRIHFAGGAEASLTGKTVTWTFPEELKLNGSGVIHNYQTTAEQLTTGVPYVEVTSKDGYITAISYRIVKASDISTAITPPYKTDVRLYIDRAYAEDTAFTYYSSEKLRNTVSGTWTLDVPQPLSTMKRISVRLYKYEDNTDNPVVYKWNFYPASEDTPDQGERGRKGRGDGCSTGLPFAGLALIAMFIRKH